MRTSHVSVRLMQHLYAPWRMEYIGGPEPTGCLFCRVREASPDQDAANLVVHRDPDALVMLNRFPYNSGHVMVAPRAHVGDLVDLGDDATLALMPLVGEVKVVNEHLTRTREKLVAAFAEDDSGPTRASVPKV